MTTQSLKRLLEFTFTFVGSFVQDGLGRHNFAIPSGKRQEHRIQDEWVDKVTTRGICSYHMHANIYKFPLAARLQV